MPMWVGLVVTEQILLTLRYYFAVDIERLGLMSLYRGKYGKGHFYFRAFKVLCNLTKDGIPSS